MQQRKNILNKKSHSLAFGFFLLLLGFYLFSYSYIENKRQEIFDNMNFKLYNQKTPSSETEEIQIPEISSVEQESNTFLESETDVIIPQYRDNANYIGTITIPKINLKAGFVSMESKENNVDKHVAIMPTSTYPDVVNGNFILAAHSGRGKIAYFNNLYQLVNGDTVTIEYRGRNYTYQIVNIYQEPKNGKVAIYRNYNKTTLTLITCTNNNSKTQTIYIAELISA